MRYGLTRRLAWRRRRAFADSTRFRDVPSLASNRPEQRLKVPAINMDQSSSVDRQEHPRMDSPSSCASESSPSKIGIDNNESPLKLLVASMTRQDVLPVSGDRRAPRPIICCSRTLLSVWRAMITQSMKGRSARWRACRPGLSYNLLTPTHRPQSGSLQ